MESDWESLDKLLADATNYNIAVLVVQGVPGRVIAHHLRLPIASVVARINAMNKAIGNNTSTVGACGRLQFSLIKYKEWHDQKRANDQP